MPKDKKKKPNIFEQRSRAIDQASGWEDPPAKKKAAPKKKSK